MSGAVKKQKRVTLFVAPGCKWCTVAKNYFKKKQIRYKLIDVSKDPKAARDCQSHGCRGVPVVLIGSQWIGGFDQKKIDKALGIA